MINWMLTEQAMEEKYSTNLQRNYPHMTSTWSMCKTQASKHLLPALSFKHFKEVCTETF